jgi:hypothetical protein
MKRMKTLIAFSFLILTYLGLRLTMEARAGVSIFGAEKDPGGESTALQDDHESWWDEFVDQNPRWDWEYAAGTGYKELTTLPGGISVVELGVTSQSNQSEYSDGSLHETSPNYQTGILETRLHLSSEEITGTTGWGFWDASLSVINAAWFWYASSDSHPDLAGFRAMVVRDNQFMFNQELSLDLEEWHVYRIELRPDGTKFYVDGAEVASTFERPANDQRAELWIDNMAVHILQDYSSYTISYLDLDQDQMLFADWVSYEPLNDETEPDPDPTPSPEPSPEPDPIEEPYLIYIPLISW